MASKQEEMMKLMEAVRNAKTAEERQAAQEAFKDFMIAGSAAAKKEHRESAPTTHSFAQPAFPQPSASDIKARIDSDIAAQNAFKDKMVETATKAAGKYSQEAVDITKAISETVLGGIKKAANFVQSGLYNGKAEKTLAHYGRLKQIDPEGAKEMLEAAVQGRVTSEWNKEVIAKGQTPGLLVAGAQQRDAIEKEVRKNPDLTMVEYYKDHELPVYSKPINALINVSEEDKVLLRKWTEYGLVQQSLRVRGKSTEEFGSTASLLGLSEKEVVEIVQKEGRRLDKAYKDGKLDQEFKDAKIDPAGGISGSSDGKIGLLAHNVQQIFTDLYLKDKANIDKRRLEPYRAGFLSDPGGESAVLYLMEKKDEVKKPGFAGNCDWVEEKYHVPGGTPLCHDNKVKSAGKN